jgi:hypothetical protein
MLWFISFLPPIAINTIFLFHQFDLLFLKKNEDLKDGWTISPFGIMQKKKWQKGYKLVTSGMVDISVTSSPCEKTARIINSSGLSTPVKAYRAASAEASKQTIPLPN